VRYLRWHPQVPAPALAALVRPDVAGAWHRGDGASSGGEGGGGIFNWKRLAFDRKK